MLSYKKILGFSFLIFSAIILHAQVNIIPAANQSKSILIQSQLLHIGDGTVIENGAIGFDDGKIIAVGKNLNPTEYDTVIITKGEVYPGFIAPNNQLGLIEIGAVRATNDVNEFGKFNPNIKTQVAYNTDSQVLPTIRSMGVLFTEPVPRRGVIKGTSSIMTLDAWNWEDATYKQSVGIHVQWPNNFQGSGPWHNPKKPSKNDKYESAVNEIINYFSEAKAYAETNNPEYNLRFDAMKGLFSKKMKLFVHVEQAGPIMEVYDFAKSMNLELVLVGASESFMILDFLKEKQIPIVLSNTQRLPSTEDTDIDMTFKLPALLAENNIPFAFGMKGFWELRNLTFQAGQSCGFGLDRNKAIQSLSQTPAQIFGIDDRTGTLEIGKDANLFISTGDILNMKEANVTHIFIQGRNVDTNNKQKALYKKYKTKYDRAK